MKVQSTESVYDSASNDIIDNNKQRTVEYRAKMCDKFEIQMSNIPPQAR